MNNIQKMKMMASHQHKKNKQHAKDKKTDVYVRTTRSGRVTKPPERYNDYYMHLQKQTHPRERTMEYNQEKGRVIVMLLQYFEYKTM